MAWLDATDNMADEFIVPLLAIKVGVVTTPASCVPLRLVIICFCSTAMSLGK